MLSELDGDGAFVVLEVWRSTDDHRSSVAGFPKDQMQEAMALLGGPPEGRYYRELGGAPAPTPE